MDHYYTSKPVSSRETFRFQAELRGRKWTFCSDAGVFSKHGIDFGSTLLIETMEVPPDGRVLDVGCGYGPIGLSAAVLAERGTVAMLDVNNRALELARENAALNGIGNVRILESDALAAVAGETFDCILTNPPIRAGKEVVHRIFTQAYDALAVGGALWVVIQKKQGSPSAWAKLEELFGEDQVEEVTKDKGYRIFRAKKKV
ncbi:class I SAM-dependent methyltransferase [Paenibacillus sp. YN15]|uniref:class I SAM-dependent methyltransferase n=1 Tax=Paenibacillus sp. YN15 TaxID=1742774 RepID=UPI000DCDD865|nr:class I SAM-dependent methyltransferase [Paenibacillus sp. YN15]RAU94539.1 16S rRNA methyltransferase [Paenibacillus sp. YN15]